MEFLRQTLGKGMIDCGQAEIILTLMLLVANLAYTK